MQIQEKLNRWAEIYGAAGEEEGIAGRRADCCRGCGAVRVDAMHNVTCTIPGGKPHVLLEAHLDHIGMVVTGIDDGGFLKVAACGGIDRRVLLSREVTVWAAQPLDGVISCQPPHLADADSYGKAPKLEEIAIDIGYEKEKAEKLVRPGDRVTLKRNFLPLAGSRFACSYLDDRAGVTAVLECLEELKGKEHGCTLSVLFSAQEELGTRGAGVGAYPIDPNECISLDVSFAATPDSDPNQCGTLSQGPMIGIAPVLSRRISRTLIETAGKRDIPYQLEVMGGTTGTNADRITLVKGGIPCGLVSIPIRYMHTPVETADARDIAATASLLAAYVMERGAQGDA
ncbi:MAG: M20/M25/M40 family metallo-hydrolase [Clostridiales bacterium]|nr:M20/M25/M40 family metallo-hydrolase [Clostridiales bacterium]